MPVVSADSVEPAVSSALLRHMAPVRPEALPRAEDRLAGRSSDPLVGARAACFGAIAGAPETGIVLLALPYRRVKLPRMVPSRAPKQAGPVGGGGSPVTTGGAPWECWALTGTL